VDFTPVESAPSTHRAGDWVVPRASVDALQEKKISYPCRELYNAVTTDKLNFHMFHTRSFLSLVCLNIFYQGNITVSLLVHKYFYFWPNNYVT